LHFDSAHEDFIQGASETGLTGLALPGRVAAFSVSTADRARWIGRDPPMRGMSFSWIGGAHDAGPVPHPYLVRCPVR